METQISHALSMESQPQNLELRYKPTFTYVIVFWVSFEIFFVDNFWTTTDVTPTLGKVAF